MRMMMNRMFADRCCSRDFFRRADISDVPFSLSSHNCNSTDTIMLGRAAQQTLRASHRAATAPCAAPSRYASNSAKVARSIPPKVGAGTSLSAPASSSSSPSSASASTPKPTVEELPRSGFFKQRPKPSPPIKKGKNADLVVPPLARPPGVPNPPTTAAKTWGEKKEQFLDADRHQAKRKAL
jgi:hypothetical protein